MKNLRSLNNSGRVSSLWLWLVLTSCVTSVTTALDLTQATITADAGSAVADGSTPVGVTVTLKTRGGAPIPGLTVVLAAVSCKIVQPTQPTNKQGQASGTIACATAGPREIAATVIGNGLVQNLTQTAVVTFFAPSDLAASISVTGLPQATLAGQSVSVSVVAQNSNGTTVTGYTGTVHFSSSDAAAVLPSDYRFQTSDQGSMNATVIFNTSGNQSFTVTDAVSNVMGSQDVPVVADLSLSTLVASPNAAVAGTPVTITANLVGLDHAPVAGAAVLLSADTCVVTQPNSITNAAGKAAGSVTCAALGAQSIAAAATVDGITQQIAPINVSWISPIAVALTISGVPTGVTAGASPTAVVTARNSFGGVATTYTGSVRLTSSDSAASLPAAYTYQPSDAGQHHFSVVFKTAGAQTLVATDAANALNSNTMHVTVAPATTYGFALRGTSQVPIGQAFSLTAYVVDSYGNVITNYAGGTAQFSATDPLAVFPANANFVASNHGTLVLADAFTLNTAGAQSITLSRNSTASLSIFANTLPLVSGQNSSLCLDSHNPASANRVTVNPCNGATTQQWQFLDGAVRNADGLCMEYAGNGNVIYANPCNPADGNQVACYYATQRYIKFTQSICSDANGICLDAGTQAANGVVVADACLAANANNAQGQQFYPPVSQALQSAIDFTLCADAADAVVGLSTCNGGATQQWQLANGQVRLNTGMCLNDPNNSLVDGTSLTTAPCSDANGEAWTFDLSTQQLRKTGHLGHCVAPAGQTIASGTPLQLTQCLGASDPNLSTQVWAVGTVSWANSAQLNACIDVANSNATLGAAVVINTCSPTALTQQWQSLDGQLRTLNNLCIYTPSVTNRTPLVLASCSTSSSGAQWMYAYGANPARLLKGGGGPNMYIFPANNNLTVGTPLQVANEGTVPSPGLGANDAIRCARLALSHARPKLGHRVSNKLILLRVTSNDA